MAPSNQIRKMNNLIETKKFKYASYHNRTFSQLITFFIHLNGTFSVSIRPQKEDGSWESFEIVSHFSNIEKALDYYFLEGGQPL